MVSGIFLYHVYYLSVAKQKTTNHDCLLSTVMISTLGIVRGHQAMPAKMGYVDPDLCASTVTRWFDCPNYNECLDVADRARWAGWTCTICSVFKALLNFT